MKHTPATRIKPRRSSENQFVSLNVSAAGEDTYTILNPSKIVAVQWQEHDDLAPHRIFCEGGHTFEVTAEEFGDLLEKAMAIGVDLSWVTAVCETRSDRKQ